jgi:glycosyltransferase involved in cell wall biosynthesis
VTVRILHVTEPTGGGVVAALMAMVAATPELDHHLITWPRRRHDDNGDAWPAALTTTSTLPADPVRARRALQRHVHAVRPDLVHAHSSFAGALVRGSRLDGPRIAYSPHCFAFERRDIGAASRHLVTRAERALAERTDLLIAASPHEMELAVDLGHRAVAYVPNRPLVTRPETRTVLEPLRVVTAGRITPQKDWAYFLHVKQYAEDHLGVSATWEWLGGGERAAEAALSAAGVRVSGWLPRADVVRRMAQASVYLHTAAWESAPITVLEAAALGLPLAIRGIAPLVSLDLPGTAGSVAAVAARVADLQDPYAWGPAREASLALGGTHSAAEQRRHLLTAYRRIAPTSVPAPAPADPPALAGAAR